MKLLKLSLARVANNSVIAGSLVLIIEHAFGVPAASWWVYVLCATLICQAITIRLVERWGNTKASARDVVAWLDDNGWSGVAPQRVYDVIRRDQIRAVGIGEQPVLREETAS